MTARLPAGGVEVHHRVPRCLLTLWDRGHGPGLEPEDLAAWFEWEEEAYRYGVDPDVAREDLDAMIDGSTVEIPAEEHRDGHAEDFRRWGRRGGIATLKRYGADWFALLSRRRWEKITADELAETFAAMSAAGRS